MFENHVAGCLSLTLNLNFALMSEREGQRLVNNLLSSIDSERLVLLAGYFGWEANQCW